MNGVRKGRAWPRDPRPRAVLGPSRTAVIMLTTAGSPTLRKADRHRAADGPEMLPDDVADIVLELPILAIGGQAGPACLVVAADATSTVWSSDGKGSLPWDGPRQALTPGTGRPGTAGAQPRSGSGLTASPSRQAEAQQRTAEQGQRGRLRHANDLGIALHGRIACHHRRDDDGLGE